MESNLTTTAIYALAAAAFAGAAVKLKTRLELSRAKHRSITGHAKISRRVAALIPYYEFGADTFFSADDAPPEIADCRRVAFERLSEHYKTSFAKTIALKREVRPAISDMQFTDVYRAPFPFARKVRDCLGSSPFLERSHGVTLSDIDGNVFYDLAGSYGVNVFGYDFYKDCLAEGVQKVADLGPVLGAYHPVVADNVARILEISGHDEISFHMSGTEAVMQAVRLARYHTGRSHLVRFSGAYHGWWGDVQPGVGNPERPGATYTLAEMSDATLRVLKTRRNIACVLVNPIQAMNPNAGPAGDSSLFDSTRKAAYDKDAYSAWLHDLRKVCSERGIVLILDEIFVGFRLAPGGAQAYFDIKADMVTYGKTLGGGLPVGVLCGRKDLMKRYRDDRPADICFARGTFNANPYVMGAMNAFLQRLDTPQCQALYRDLDATWNARAAKLNGALSAAGVPVQVVNMQSIWTIIYTAPSRYNWMLQFYLRKHGLALSWVGTGRLIFSLNYTDQDFDAVMQRFVAAGVEMRNDQWWWQDPDPAKPPLPIKRRVFREMLKARLKR